MRDVMVDLETVGNRPGCGILSIGAVYFDASGLGQEFYKVVRLETCEKAGLDSQQDTLDWWEKQSKDAQKVLTQARKKTGNLPLLKALKEFNEFLSLGGQRTVKLWGNGSDFDNAILAVAYSKVDLKPGWEFWNNRCYRTLKNLFKHVELSRAGVHHNALDDAKTQAEHAVRILGATALAAALRKK